MAKFSYANIADLIGMSRALFNYHKTEKLGIALKKGYVIYLNIQDGLIIEPKIKENKELKQWCIAANFEPMCYKLLQYAGVSVKDVIESDKHIKNHELVKLYKGVK